MEDNQANRVSKYQKVNSYTHSPSIPQIMGAAIMLTIIILHSNIIEKILEIAHPTLFILFALYYIILLLVLYDYFILTTYDPADPRLYTPDFKENQEDLNRLQFCNECKINVHQFSYHCHNCNRCTDHFDHHCKFLNNCIGGKNYSHFFRLLVTMILFTSLGAAQGLWVFLADSSQYRWVRLALSILNLVVFLEISSLAIFHVYITVFEHKTTIQFLREKGKESNGNRVRPVISDNIEQFHTKNVSDHKKSSLKKIEEENKGETTQIALKKISSLE